MASRVYLKLVNPWHPRSSPFITILKTFDAEFSRMKRVHFLIGECLGRHPRANSTIGSPRRLNDVLNMTGTPVAWPIFYQPVIARVSIAENCLQPRSSIYMGNRRVEFVRWLRRTGTTQSMVPCWTVPVCFRQVKVFFCMLGK